MSAVLVVGAGFAGAVYARTLADAGFTVHVIDRREHIGGNAADFVDANGVRVHRYGPHLFHTNATHVFDWVQRFAAFVPYRHRCGRICRMGACAVAGQSRHDQRGVRCEAVYRSRGRRLPARTVGADPEPRNAAEHLRSRIGDTLTDLFFRPYTRKMWALELEDLDASVVRRFRCV